jgi:hypothetical protein
MDMAPKEHREEPDDQQFVGAAAGFTNRREIVKRVGALALGGLAIVAAVRATEADDDDGGGGGSDDDGGGGGSGGGRRGRRRRRRRGGRGDND